MRDRLIVALDMSEPAHALGTAKRLRGVVPQVKVGLTLFATSGPGIVDRLREYGFDVFVDLKLHDIPHQVRGATAELTCLGASMITVHASGGAEMVAAAVQGADEGAVRYKMPRPKVLAVTVLTSMSAEQLAATGVLDSPAEQVRRLAQLSMGAGADGVVCSPEEAEEMRALLGPDALIITPGVRPEWAERGDQTRVATPAAAIAAGADFIVIGRPVTEAEDPAAAVERIIAEKRETAST
jgi:orotidine-5'-phosphate decarboxylase